MLIILMASSGRRAVGRRRNRADCTWRSKSHSPLTT